MLQILLIFSFLSQNDLFYLKKTLNFLNISEKSLGYKKDWTLKDSFRLPWIDSVFNKPLHFPGFCQQISDSIIHSSNNPAQTLSFLSSLLPPYKKNKIKFHKFEKIEINRFIQTLESLCDSFSGSFNNLNKSEKEFLSKWLPIVWSEKDVPEDTLKKLLNISLKVDFRKMWIYSVEILNLLIIVKDNPKFFDKLTFTKYTSWGKISIGGRENDVYEGGYLLIIDFKGDDIYKLENRFSFVVDFEGDDKYRDVGGGQEGLAYIFDFKGDDEYRGKNNCIGAGILGVGLVMDYEGNDYYEADRFGIGAGFLGIGLVLDINGDDIYKVGAYGEGMGGTLGVGLLFDKNGDDVYYAGGKYPHKPLLPNNYRSMAQGFAIGFRPFASGGIGLLLDLEGNDKYIAEVYAQGCSYWYSLGILVDFSGDDFYDLVEYGQGAGIHLSCGFLSDLGGDDRYFSRYGPSIGEGHDFSVGFLIDTSGNDFYYVSGGIGVGLYNSVGVFVDKRGDDIYVVKEKIGIGDVKWSKRKYAGACGIFMDMEGKDVYYSQDTFIKNNSIWFQNDRSIGMDADIYFPIPVKLKDTTLLYEGLRECKNLEDSLNFLWGWVVKWGVGENRVIVPKARELFVKLFGEKGLKFIFDKKIKTTYPLYLRAIKEIVKKQKIKAVPFLKKALLSCNDTIVKNTAWLCGEIEDTFTVDLRIKLFKKFSNNPWVLRTIITSLGKSKLNKVFAHIKSFLNHNDETIVVSSIYALGYLDTIAVFNEIYKFLLSQNLSYKLTSYFIFYESVPEKAIPFLLDKYRHSDKISEKVEILNVLSKILENKKSEIKIWRDKIFEVVEKDVFLEDAKLKFYLNKIFKICGLEGRRRLEDIWLEGY